MFSLTLLFFLSLALIYGLHAKPLIDPTEEITASPIKMTLRCSTGNYLNHHYGKERVNCDDRFPGPHEHFLVNHISSQSKISLKADESLFVALQPDYPSHPILISNSISESPLATFEQTTNGDGSVSFKCLNGQFMWVDTADGSVSCTGNEIHEQSKFVPEPVN
ncbi:hypothetical protein DdX_21208 [Ditylenchus destructor]|uniref:Uncharacterized protein n=1 Tax=Ditylenchus destructor TaxID=166010 RepID=A0AAD4MGU4_9BILA|nr:hypothetical protein DdX_21208 [Ditylenchus destructor]